MLLPSRSSLLSTQPPDRVVTLTALSDRVPTQFISETFSHSLRAETGSSVLLIHLEAGRRIGPQRVEHGAHGGLRLERLAGKVVEPGGADRWLVAQIGLSPPPPFKEKLPAES